MEVPLLKFNKIRCHITLFDCRSAINWLAGSKMFTRYCYSNVPWEREVK